MENENNTLGNLFLVDEAILNKEKGINKILNIYNKTKNSENWDGIRVIGDLNYYNIHTDDEESLSDFFREVVYVDGTLTLPFGDFDNDLSKLKIVGGNMWASDIEKGSFPNLEEVKEDLDLISSFITELPKLRRVGGDFRIDNSDINSLPELEYVGLHLVLNSSKIEDLPKLEYVGGLMSVFNTPMADKNTKEELSNKIKVGGYIQL